MMCGKKNDNKIPKVPIPRAILLRLETLLFNLLDIDKHRNFIEITVQF